MILSVPHSSGKLRSLLDRDGDQTWVVAKGDGLEAGFQDGRQFLRSLKRKRINNQPLATILNHTPTPHLTLILSPKLTLILTQTLISILEQLRKLPLVRPF